MKSNYKNIKIAFVDNMNNNFYTLAKYYRKIGCEVTLYIINNNSLEHFMPKSNILSLEDDSWIKYFPSNYSIKSFFFLNKKKIYNEFKNYNMIFACGFSIAQFYKSNIKVNVFLPYGADLFNFPFIPNYYSLFHFIPRFLYYFFRGILQKKGIMKNVDITFCPNKEPILTATKKLAIKNYNTLTPRVYYEDLKNILESNDEYWSLIFKDNYDLIIFSPTRHVWKTNSDPIIDFKKYGGIKANNKLIIAFSKIVSKEIYSNPLLIFIEYGTDIDDSKKLIKKLGIEKFVKWLPIMNRKKLFQGMSKADIIADQFRKGLNSSLAGISQEGLALGKPVITNTEGSILDKKDPHYKAPYLQATTVEEIYNILVDFNNDKEKYLTIGLKSKKWFLDNFNDSLFKSQIDFLIENKFYNKNIF